MRVRLFIDFWNFTLQWKDRTADRVDWKLVPSALCRGAEKALQQASLGSLQLEEARVYASYGSDQNDAKLKNFLHSFLDKQPGVRVFTTQRRWRKRPVHCRACGTNHAFCPNPECGAPLGRAIEKGVDAQIVTDLMGLAWENAYDVALLVSSDADFVPAVERLQAKNFKVVNATWKGHGHELARVCWASFLLDDIVSEVVRQPT